MSMAEIYNITYCITAVYSEATGTKVSFGT